MKTMTSILLSGAVLLFLVVTGTSEAEEIEIPQCASSYGNLALREPQQNTYWWRHYNLENPEALIKYYVSKSGCFTLVDRGEGLDMRTDERGLADSGELQVQSNMGKGQLLAADFFLIPDLVAKDADSGGKGFGGLIGGKVGGKVGGLLGGLKTKKLEAETILTLTNARTGVQQVTARGHAQKTDIKFGGAGVLGAVAAIGGGYDDTEIGRVISTAYARAYSELVADMGNNAGAGDTSAPMQAYTMAVSGEMYTGPARGSSVRKLRAGTTVYPTGKREGAFLEVKDKFGTQGWVSVEDLQ